MPYNFYSGFLIPKILLFGTPNKFSIANLLLKVCYEVVLVSLRLSVRLVTVNDLFSGSRECNPIPTLTRCDTEIWLTLHVIQPCMHVGFNPMRRHIYTSMQT